MKRSSVRGEKVTPVLLGYVQFMMSSHYHVQCKMRPRELLREPRPNGSKIQPRQVPCSLEERPQANSFFNVSENLIHVETLHFLLVGPASCADIRVMASKVEMVAAGL